MQLLNRLEGLSYRLFGRLAPKFLGNVFEFTEQLDKARIKIYPQTYVSLMFFCALLGVPVTIAAFILVSLYQFIPLIFLVPMPCYIMIGFMVMPMSMASDRGNNLEMEMPFAATYITVMASGGIPPYLSFKRLTNVELMPAMSKEAREIIKDVEILGVDPLTAMESAAKKNPLDIFRDFVAGYASAVIIGGDVSHYLETKSQDIFKTRSARVKVAADRLGMLLETFIIVMVLMSLCFYILFSVESIYSTGGSSFTTMLMYTYIFTPMLSVVFIYLAHSMQPKTPITDWKPYKVFGLSSLVAIPIVLLLNGFFGIIQTPLDWLKDIVDLPTTVAISLFICTAPAALVYGKLSRKRSSTESGIASFLRDLTETRKTGLSPERCIESLSKRDYGAFSPELRRITSQISWGVSVRRVFMDFVTRTKSWLSQIVIFLLVETIDVGGGTIAMIESLARFNAMTQEVEKEKKMSVRPYIMIPYFAAVMLVATTIMTLTFTAKTLEVGGVIAFDLEFLKMIFTTSGIIHCFLIGLVAGKISEESLAAGFKHSAILVIIALVASEFVPMFLGDFV
ncbi:MAG: type II secretion system F family protein [Candidatus Bathyarchaeota archaeon]|nr:type II secretion system F family protein [Candidatus Bathyarchaeota archaeon]